MRTTDQPDTPAPTAAPRARRVAVGSAVLALAAGGLLSGGAVTASADAPTASERTRHQELQQAKAASARFHDVSYAIAQGYQPTDHCDEIATGAMGYHYAKPSNFGSTDPDRPAVLLYAPDGHGGVRLAGVEWVVPDADQDLTTDGDRPTMFGGQPFDGPMEGHFDGMPRHYDLHVWLWEKNPDGVFAQWNPAFRCP